MKNGYLVHEKIYNFSLYDNLYECDMSKYVNANTKRKSEKKREIKVQECQKNPDTNIWSGDDAGNIGK